MKERLSLPHIGSGDLFRYHLREKTALGMRAAEYMNQGLLVPDEVTVDIILDKMLGLPQAEGFILDGFPRTNEQAAALDQAPKQGSRKLEKVLFIDVPEDELIRRLRGRYICRDCQAHHSVGEGEEGKKCVRCGGELYQRDDDAPAAVKKRLEVYKEETMPVLDFYRERGVLVHISGDNTVDEVNKEVMEALGA